MQDSVEWHSATVTASDVLRGNPYTPNAVDIAISLNRYILAKGNLNTLKALYGEQEAKNILNRAYQHPQLIPPDLWGKRWYRGLKRGSLSNAAMRAIKKHLPEAKPRRTERQAPTGSIISQYADILPVSPHIKAEEMADIEARVWQRLESRLNAHLLRESMTPTRRALPVRIAQGIMQRVRATVRAIAKGE